MCFLLLISTYHSGTRDPSCFPSHLTFWVKHSTGCLKEFTTKTFKDNWPRLPVAMAVLQGDTFFWLGPLTPHEVYFWCASSAPKIGIEGQKDASNLVTCAMLITMSSYSLFGNAGKKHRKNPVHHYETSAIPLLSPFRTCH